MRIVGREIKQGLAANNAHFLQKCDIPTDGPTDRRTNGRTHPLIEMRARILKLHPD